MAYIFSGLGSAGFAKLPCTDGKNYSFITFKLLGGTSDTAMTTILDAVAPITSISVKQEVDFSITKSLKSDFYAAAFGDKPVSISISGLQLYWADAASKGTLASFYTSNKLSANPSARLLVSINWGPKAERDMFKCIVTSLTLTGDSKPELGGAGVCEYAMELIGVNYKEAK